MSDGGQGAASGRCRARISCKAAPSLDAGRQTCWQTGMQTYWDGHIQIVMDRWKDGADVLRSHFERALARAAAESSFRVRLLTDPAETLGEYGLAADDAARIERLRVHSLPEFATAASQHLWRDLRSDLRKTLQPHAGAAEIPSTVRRWLTVIEYCPSPDQPY